MQMYVFALFVVTATASVVAAQWDLTQLTTPLGPVNVRNETVAAPTPANNFIAPASGSVTSLNKVKNFIIIINNQESYDAVLGAYSKGNGIGSSTATPAFTPQVVRGQYAGSPYAVTPTAAYSSLSPDPAGQLGSNTLPNKPFLFSNYSIMPNTTLSHDPEHGFFQTIYKIDSGKMDGFMWSGTSKSGALPMGYWNLTGSTLWSLAANYTLFDKFFSSLYGGPLLGHVSLIGGRPTVWDNGRSQPPLVLTDNVTLTYTNYSTVDGLQYVISQEGILTYPDNYVINNIHSPHFCGPPFFPVIDDISTTGVAANLADQLDASGITWAYYGEDWNDEVIDAATSDSDNCKHIGNDTKMSSNMLPFTHYAKFNPPSAQTSSWTTHLLDMNVGAGNFYAKAAAGTLEQVTWVQPDKRHDWGMGDVSPAASDSWLGSVMNTIFMSPQWLRNETMVVVTFSNANGAYDHVPPYAGDRFGPGLRLPLIVVSPYHTGGNVNSNPFEHYSIIKMIQSRFRLNNGSTNPLWTSTRDQSIADLTTSLQPSGSNNATSSSTGFNSASSSTGSHNAASSTGSNAASARFSADYTFTLLILSAITIFLVA